MYAPLASGTLLDNRYRVVGVARQGAFGQTYLARDQKQLNELCVLKEFIPVQQDPVVVNTLLQLFHKEAATLYEMRHPQLPRPRAMIAEGNRFYWIREYVEGKSYGVTLDSRRSQGQVFSEPEVIQLLMQVLPVLTYLHDRGVVHGNLSLDSIILRQKDQLPVLISYGLLRDLVMRLQLHPVKPDAVLSPWGFIPPEKLHEGKLYPNSDLYSLGVVAIALLTGKAPEELYNQQTQSFEWEPLTSVHPKVARILRQMLDPRPQKRFASATQVMQALEPLLEFSPQASNDDAIALPREPVVASGQPSVLDQVAGQAVGQVGVAASQPGAPVSPPTAPPQKRPRPKPRNVGDPRATAAMVVGIAMLVGVIAWRVLSSVRSTSSPPESATPELATPDRATPDRATPDGVTNPAAEPSSPDKAPLDQKNAAPAQATEGDTSTEALRQRLQTLGVDSSYFTTLVDDVFAAQNPQANPQSADSKAEWNATASSLLSKLETLAPDTRKKLGAYQLADYKGWLAELGEAGKKNSPTLDALADGQFFKLFPEWQGRPLKPSTTGQVWFAIAESMVDKAKARKAGR